MIDEHPPTVVRSRPARRRSRSDALLGVWGVLVLAFLFLPIAVIVVYSFNSGRLLTSWAGRGSRRTRPVVPAVIRAAVATSLQSAAGAALLSAVIGSLAGLALARVRGRWAAR